MRVITAAIMVLACVAFLWLLGDYGLRTLSGLPHLKPAPSAAPESAPAVPRGEPAASTAQAPATETTTSPATPPASDRSGVRFIERDGIVSVRVDGPLERAPAVVKEAPPAPPPKEEPDLYRLVVIESAGIIDVRSHKVALAHVDAPAPEATCRNADGSSWPCGMRARTAMRRLIRRRAIACTDPAKKAVETAQAEGATRTDAAPRKGETRTLDCTVGNIDLSEWLLENGWAEPTPDAPEDLRTLNANARAARVGLYATSGR